MSGKKGTKKKIGSSFEAIFGYIFLSGSGQSEEKNIANFRSF